MFSVKIYESIELIRESSRIIIISKYLSKQKKLKVEIYEDTLHQVIRIT